MYQYYTYMFFFSLQQFRFFHQRCVIQYLILYAFYINKYFLCTNQYLVLEVVVCLFDTPRERVGGLPKSSLTFSVLLAHAWLYTFMPIWYIYNYKSEFLSSIFLNIISRVQQILFYQQVMCALYSIIPQHQYCGLPCPSSILSKDCHFGTSEIFLSFALIIHHQSIALHSNIVQSKLSSIHANYAVCHHLNFISLIKLIKGWLFKNIYHNKHECFPNRNCECIKLGISYPNRLGHY